MFLNRRIGPPWSVRRRTAWLVLGAALAAGLVLAGTDGAPRLGAATLKLLAWAPADPRCGHPVGQLATLARGDGLPDEGCLGELATNRLARPLLVRLAKDSRQPMPVRSSALAALTASGTGPRGLLESFVFAPNPPPALRRAAWDVALRGRDEPGLDQAGLDEPGWVERGKAVAVHGLYDRAAAARYAAGEPGTALDAARALAASPRGAPDPAVLRDVYRGLGITHEQLAEGVRRHAAGQMPLGLPPEWADAFWRHGCEEACVPLLLDLLAAEADRGSEEAALSAPAVPGADAAIDALYADGERADHVREELAAVAGWIGRGGEARRAARLVAAVLHPAALAQDAAESLAEAGDPHAVLVRGGGTPGATALVAADLALATGVPLAAWVTDTGVALLVGGGLHRVDACAAATPLGAPDDSWRPVPATGIEALALVEGAARALREGDPEAASGQLEAARRAWADAPGLRGVAAAVIASGLPDTGGAGAAPPAGAGLTESAVAPAGLAGAPAPGVTFVSRPAWPPPRRGRRLVAPPADPRPAARAALVARLEQIRGLTTDPEELVRAAWWAAHAGDPELARRLLEAPLHEALVNEALVKEAPSALARVLRGAVARGVGEPAAPPAAPDATPPCSAPFGADPPRWAWDGRAPTER
ncbi:MAG: hypothetical protein Q8P18_19925 [Pseudomonadota bacterium]|nr:hypothetical protein [Pseudomonadota bacterium]